MGMLIVQLLQPTLLQHLYRLLNFFLFYQDTQQSVFARWNHAEVVKIYFLVRVSKYLDETKLFQLHSILIQLLDFPNLLLLQVFLPESFPADLNYLDQFNLLMSNIFLFLITSFKDLLEYHLFLVKGAVNKTSN